MNIAIHSNSFDKRGCGKVPLDYAIGLKKIFNINTFFIASSLHANEGKKQIENHGFKVFTYDFLLGNTEQENKKIKDFIEKKVQEEKIEFFHAIKGGENDFIDPSNCKSGAHCIFHMKDPHSNVYVGVSEYLAKKYNQNKFLPHIINQYPPTENFRKKYNIPKDAFVIGRCGGNETFNIPFVKECISFILNQRKDVYFFFLSTDPFINHERVIHVDWVPTEQEKYNFIHSCDCMIHARMGGETFGLAVGEFSACNKPIITWSGNNQGFYETCHLSILKEKALIYNDPQELINILSNLNKSFVASSNWDMYSECFSEEKVVNKYKKLFLI